MHNKHIIYNHGKALTVGAMLSSCCILSPWEEAPVSRPRDWKVCVCVCVCVCVRACAWVQETLTILYSTSSCARYARFATCCHRRIWHVAAVHQTLCNLYRHAPIKSIPTMDCHSGRNLSWEQHSVSGDDPSTCIQQSTHYYIILFSHCLLHLDLCLHFNL